MVNVKAAYALGHDAVPGATPWKTALMNWRVCLASEPNAVLAHAGRSTLPAPPVECVLLNLQGQVYVDGQLATPPSVMPA